VVLLTLEQGTRSPEYADQLASLLQGSRLRNQDDVVRDLTENLRPSDLIDTVEANDAQRLGALLNRDLGQMARLIAYLADNPNLYGLEGAVFDDRLEITLYDGGVAKPVGQLSKGQMATALLPLILRSADYPLVFDQPEDDLDNRFIYSTLVETITRLKSERQLIFVTHNANIPVLGEADQVVVMSMETPVQAAPPLTGSVEDVKTHILTLLEGGADAFRRRQRKYGDLLE
jgi:ATPase subunit of ABC transporter with duplicated ATPase domains